MLPRNQSLLGACLVFAAALGWLLHQPPTESHGTVVSTPAAAPGAKYDKPPTPTALAIPVQTTTEPPVAPQQAPVVSAPLPDDFLRRILAVDEKSVIIPLPGGDSASGSVSLIRRDKNGLLLVQGIITHPEAGRFMFQRQTLPGKAGLMVGYIYYNHSKTAWQVRPDGENGAPVLVKTTVDSVICRAYAAPAAVEAIPATHPTDYPIPPDENGIIQLQSLPGAEAVVYLDFDGEERNFNSWGLINAAPSGASNAQIFEVWQGVCEDFQPFGINITTVRAVYETATPGRRIQVVVTPTDDAYPGAGGVAITGSFNWTGEIVCWSFSTTGKNAVEAISHEVGHTLGLAHDGRISPYEEYFRGANGWAPIMGVGYYQPLTQWAKGEYPNANNLQDDLQIITTTNNAVTYRNDDHGASSNTASWLVITSGGAVSNEGIIETSSDRDAFRFSTIGGVINLQINPVNYGNLDVKAELLSVTSTLITTIATSDPANSRAATFFGLNLPAGDYLLRVSGTGKGDLITGYSDYASLGSYTVTGTINGGMDTEQFTIAENAANGSAVGKVAARADHDGGSLTFAIASSGAASAFAIDPATGAITVADQSLLDYEALSTRWDAPAAIELFVSISDSLDYATEIVRVAIDVTNVNEPPDFPPLPTVTIPDTLSLGMMVATASATDQDHGDYVSYAITAGNDDGHFTIDAATGVITLASPPDYQAMPVHQITLRATDHLTPANQVEVPLTISLIDVAGNLVTGSIVRMFFSGIDGAELTTLTDNPQFPDKPNSEVVLTCFDSGLNQGVNYGCTMRGYLVAPATGQYTFWISADDSGELLISTDAEPANALPCASITSPAAPGEWTSQPGQQSHAVALTAGAVYYIEARHKQGTGSDHVEVAWQGPGMAGPEIIPGRWLAPFHQQHAPWAPDLAATVREAAPEGTLVSRVSYSFIEPNIGEEIASYAITGGNQDGFFTIDPLSSEIRVAAGAALAAGTSYGLTVSATDDGSPAATGDATVNITVIGLDENLYAWWQLDEAAGSVLTDSSGNDRHAWLAGVGAWLARSPSNPALQLNGSDTHFTNYDIESLYGEQPFTVAAWVKIPVTHASTGILIQQLDPSGEWGPGRYDVAITSDGRVRFSVYGWDSDWDNLDNQFEITSPQAIHDGEWHHVACVRDGPNGRIFIDGLESATGFGSIRMLEFESITVVGYDASTESAFLDAAVDDVRVYAEALIGPQIVEVASIPVFSTSPLVGHDATKDITYVGNLATSASDPDPDDTLVFTKTDGPEWLVVAEDGTLSGTPAGTDAGINLFVISVTDSQGAGTSATLQITVCPLPTVNVTASDPSAAETGPVPGVFTITRSGSTIRDLTVAFVIEGTAINGVDYDEIPSSVIIPSGAESVTLTITPAADALIEGSETVALVLAEGPYEPDEFYFAALFIRDSNHAPFFLRNPVVTPSALVGESYTGESLAEHAGDPNLPDGDTLSFEKLGGPDWLSIGLDGTLSGLPGEIGLGTNVFSVRVTDSQGLTADGNLQITVKVRSPFENWQLAEFGPQAGDPQVAGESADPDQDGLSNLLEYALDTDPNHGDAAHTELEMVDNAGTATMRLTYFINPAAQDITLIVEATDDLTNPNGWSNENLIIEEVTTARLVVRDTVAGPRRFFRLRVTH